MHELKRRAYLDAMGIATYVSRGPLDGAAPTNKLVIVRRPVAGARALLQVKQAEQPVADASHSPRVDRPLQSEHKQVIAGAAPVGRSKTAPPVAFSVVAIMAGNWLWLEELPRQQALMRDQLLLVQAMAQALGWDNHKPDVSQFGWPIHTNSQLDLGAEAARASLGSFVGRKLEGDGCRGLVLLGSDCQRWLPPQCLPQAQTAARQCVATVSTAQMLHNPQLKKQAWRDLLPYSGCR